MKHSKWSTYLTCGILVLTTLAVAALASGTQGSQTNPLVTLDYLNEKAIPQIMEQVDAKVDAGLETLRETLEESGLATFHTTTAKKKQTVTLSAGTQIILRTGAGSCQDGLIDLTTGETAWGELSKNHLYVATADGQTLTVSEDSTFLVLGTSEIS